MGPRLIYPRGLESSESSDYRNPLAHYQFRLQPNAPVHLMTVLVNISEQRGGVTLTPQSMTYCYDPINMSTHLMRMGTTHPTV